MSETNEGDAGANAFAEFEAAGEVEVGSEIESNQDEKAAKPDKPAPRARAKPAEKVAEKSEAEEEIETVGTDEEDDGDEGEEEEKPEKKPKTASDRIRELNTRLRQEQRLRAADAARLDALEKRLLSGDGNTGNDRNTGTPSPDPSDEAKYPLGHLDDRYIEDKLEWLAEQKAAKQADAVLQRQQEGEQRQQAEQAHAALLEKVDDLSTRGAEQFDDFQEAVVEAGMRGDWRLERATFEAASESDHGPQILYELSQDKKEAARVAKLSDYQQMKFVMDRDAELSGKRPRTKPGAGEPPQTRTRGANSSTRINPATDNLDSFEKAWIADAKGH